MELDPHCLRVLGALIEKDLATPEYYPLTRAGLLVACNQKSNRDPVLTLDEGDVERALERLKGAGLAYRSGEGGRAARYAHNATGKLHLEPNGMAVLAELLLRGPQTPGELRARAERMHHFDGLPAIEETLAWLKEREPPLVEKLVRQPGHKEARWRHLLGAAAARGEESISSPPGEPRAAAGAGVAMALLSPPRDDAGPGDDGRDERIARLEDEVRFLRGEVSALWKELRSLTGEPTSE